MLVCMNCYSHPRSNAGLTLVEVMVALGIFMLVIVGAFLAIGRGFDLVEGSRHYTRSSQILQSEIELLRTLPWATFSVLDDDTLTSRFKTQIDSQFGAGTYDGKVATTMTGGDRMRVDVSVAWTDANSKTKTVTYTTYFTEGGVNDYYIN